MSDSQSEQDREKRARDTLVKQYLSHPDVSLIGIGKKTIGQKEQTVLRIHVRDQWIQSDPQTRIHFPNQVDGIPVEIVAGDYRFE